MEDSTIPPRAPTPPFDSRCYWSSSSEEEDDDDHDEPPAYRQDYLISDADLPPYALPDKMPHTSRRARFSKPKPKKAVLDAGDGWSRVEYGYRTDAQGGTMRSNIMMPPVDKELSVQKMKEEHEKILGRWRSSEHRKAMVRELEKRRPSEEKEGESKGWGVSKAVCIALGSLSMEWHVRIRSVWQFAFFMDVVDLLQPKDKSEEAIKIYVQEPRFSSLDIEFFKSMGITVLEDPAAEAEVGAQSFAFIPHLEWISEIPYLQEGIRAPLYITSSAEWIYDEAERMKNRYGHEHEAFDLKHSDDAMAASMQLRATHHELRFDEDLPTIDSLNFSYYILKDKQERDEDDELADKIGSLNV